MFYIKVGLFEYSITVSYANTSTRGQPNDAYPNDEGSGGKKNNLQITCW